MTVSKAQETKPGLTPPPGLPTPELGKLSSLEAKIARVVVNSPDSPITPPRAPRNLSTITPHSVEKKSSSLPIPSFSSKADDFETSPLRPLPISLFSDDQFSDEPSQFNKRGRSEEERKVPPPAPTKKGRSMVKSPFEIQHENLKNGNFKFNATYLAKGTFASVYTLAAHPTPVIADKANSNLVLKAFHGQNTGFGQSKLSRYLSNSAENYRTIVNYGLPVAEIYNINTVEKDLYVIQRKIPEAINCMDVNQLQQVAAFFDVSVKQNVIMDLQPQNFRVENGIVVLIDFVEDIDPDDDEQIAIFNRKACEAWYTLLQQAGLPTEQIRTRLNQLSGNHFNEYVEQLITEPAFVVNIGSLANF